MESIFEALVQKEKDKFGVWHFDCPVGLWGVYGKDKKMAEREAKCYFSQYLADGEYNDIASHYEIKI